MAAHEVDSITSQITRQCGDYVDEFRLPGNSDLPVEEFIFSDLRRFRPAALELRLDPAPGPDSARNRPAMKRMAGTEATSLRMVASIRPISATIFSICGFNAGETSPATGRQRSRRTQNDCKDRRLFVSFPIDAKMQKRKAGRNQLHRTRFFGLLFDRLVDEAMPDDGYRPEIKEGFEARLSRQDMLKLAALRCELDHRKLVVRII